MPVDPKVGGEGVQVPARELQEGQLDLPTALLGIPRPPMPVRLALIARATGWRGLAWTLDRRDGHLRRWVTQQPGARILHSERAPDDPLVLSLGDAHPARAWLVEGHGWIQITVGPEGPATLIASGTTEHLEALRDNLVGQAQVRGQDVPDGWTWRPTRYGLLTARQNEAVRWAVAAGYYSVPRRIRLKDLADQMGTSIGALSTLLRRAEARLLEAYLDAEPLLGDLLTGISLTREVPRGATWRTVTDAV